MAAAHALRDVPLQLPLYGPVKPANLLPAVHPATRARQRPPAPMCAGCRAREARYGFRYGDDPAADRPRTLCFECFRVEVGRRQAVAARLARGWNAQQVTLPMEETLQALTLRRRRAQIAARKALELT